jgi:hypothetical protein
MSLQQLHNPEPGHLLARTLEAEAAELELQGVMAYVGPRYLARVRELDRIPDDWDLADFVDDTLVRVTKGDFCIELSSSGERRLDLSKFNEETQTWEQIEYWKNNRPEEPWMGYLKHEQDWEFVHEDFKYRFEIQNNGWIETQRLYKGEWYGDPEMCDFPVGPAELAVDLISWEQSQFWNQVLVGRADGC